MSTRSLRGFRALAVLSVVALVSSTRSAAAQTAVATLPPATVSGTELVAPSYHMESRPSPWLMVPGSVVLGLAYAGAVTSAIASRCPNNRWMALPLAGPFVTGAKYDTNYQGACSDPEAINQAVARLDGVVQGIGALLIVGSLLLPTHTVVRDVTTLRGTATVSWQLTPLSLGKTGGGLGVLGTF